LKGITTLASLIEQYVPFNISLAQMAGFRIYMTLMGTTSGNNANNWQYQ
jgi:hypothetical protein